MALAFRNVDASPDDPVETWPFEGVLAALERGGLSDWRRLARAIAERPWGQVARYVEQAIRLAEPFGVTEIMTDVLTEARRDMEASERQEVTETVHRLVTASGLTQARFAAEIGTSPSRLSTYASGTVVPSAAMLVRMRRVSEALSGEPGPFQPR